MHLACMLDGGLCIVAFLGISSFLGWLGVKKLNATKHPHEDCGDCKSTPGVEGPTLQPEMSKMHSNTDPDCKDCASRGTHHCNLHCGICNGEEHDDHS
jgi:hypothetical protein